MTKFVFDIDGTLCFDRRSIAEEVKEVLKAAPTYGHEVIFATARSYRDCLQVLGDDLKQNTVIGLNGGIVYEKGELLFETNIGTADYRRILDWMETHRLPFFVDNAFDYGGEMIEKMPFYGSVDPLKKASFLPLNYLDDPVKIVVLMSNHERILEETLAYFCRMQNLDVSYHNHEQCIYINPVGINKATTAAAICGTPFVAFGNDQNDIELFQASVYAIQVGDFPHLMPYADETIPLPGGDSESLAAKIRQIFTDFA